MSFDATAWAWSVQGLTSGEKLILLALADCENSADGECHPSTNRLSHLTGQSQSSVFKNLERLRSKGLIVSERRFKRNGIIGSLSAQHTILRTDNPRVQGSPELLAKSRDLENKVHE